MEINNSCLKTKGFVSVDIDDNILRNFFGISKNDHIPYRYEFRTDMGRTAYMCVSSNGKNIAIYSSECTLVS
jgi:hypothetical protein